jgi:hypothetical protein
MDNYLREQSAGEILRGTVRIYRRNFIALYGLYLLPTFPFVLLKLYMWGSHGEWYFYLWLALWLFITPFATAALSACVSDICVGNRPSILRSLRRVLGTTFWKLIITNLFVFVIMGAVCALAVWASALPRVPDALRVVLVIASVAATVMFLVWWMFVPTVVVLEGTFLWKAMKTSKALGKGFYLRNSAVIFLLWITILILGWIAFFYLQIADNIVLKTIGVLIELALAPLPLIATILLYYDLRARSEGYDLAMLSQDLKR